MQHIHISTYHLLQIPKACSNLSLPKSPSPFCNAANANFVSSTASAIWAFDNFVDVDDDALPNGESLENILLVLLGEGAAAGGGGNGLLAAGGGIAGVDAVDDASGAIGKYRKI